MPDVLTLLISPIIVGTILLVIEYWIIKPIRNRKPQYGSTTNTSPNAQNSRSARWINVSLLITGLGSLSVTIAIILSIIIKSIKDIRIKIPQLLPITDANIVFVAGFYACFIFTWLSARFSKFLSIMILSFMPAILLAIWLIAFFPETSSYIPVICIGWVFGILVVHDFEGTIKVKLSNLIGTMVLVIPAYALYFKYYCKIPTYEAWFRSVLFSTSGTMLVTTIVAVTFYHVKKEFKDMQAQ
jgi:hypothetical protein